jgi:hypothetical protein
LCYRTVKPFWILDCRICDLKQARICLQSAITNPKSKMEKRPGGFEPPHPPWQGGRLPGYIMDAASSGGWVRATDLPCFRRTLLPTELHRSYAKPAVGLEPTRSALRERRSARRASPASIPVRSRTSSPTFAGSCAIRHTPRIISTPARNRTWTCSFGGSHDVRFTTRVLTSSRKRH